MTFAVYWERLCEATPQLRDPEAAMRITVASLRKSLERAYHRGGCDKVDDMRRDAGIEAIDMPDFFKGLFG